MVVSLLLLVDAENQLCRGDNAGIVRIQDLGFVYLRQDLVAALLGLFGAVVVVEQDIGVAPFRINTVGMVGRSDLA